MMRRMTSETYVSKWTLKTHSFSPAIVIIDTTAILSSFNGDLDLLVCCNAMRAAMLLDVELRSEERQALHLMSRTLRAASNQRKH